MEENKLYNASIELMALRAIKCNLQILESNGSLSIEEAYNYIKGIQETIDIRGRINYKNTFGTEKE